MKAPFKSIKVLEAEIEWSQHLIWQKWLSFGERNIFFLGKKIHELGFPLNIIEFFDSKSIFFLWPNKKMVIKKSIILKKCIIMSFENNDVVESKMLFNIIKTSIVHQTKSHKINRIKLRLAKSWICKFPSVANYVIFCFYNWQHLIHYFSIGNFSTRTLQFWGDYNFWWWNWKPKGFN